MDIPVETARPRVADRPPFSISESLLRWESVLSLLLITVVVINSALSPYFLNINSLSDASTNFSEQAIIAIPVALLILVREIDLSVGAIVSLASLAIGLTSQLGAPAWVLVCIGIAVGLVCGTINGALVTYFKLPSIVITIGTLSVFRGISEIVLADHAITNYSQSFQAIGQGLVIDWPPISTSFALFIVLSAVFGTLLKFTRYGRVLYAIGANPIAARFTGLPVDRIRFLLFSLTGSLTGLAAVLLTGRIASTMPGIAEGWELVVITMAVLGGFSITGGVGTIIGLVLSVFVIGMITWGLLLANFSGVEINVVLGTVLILTISIPPVIRRMLAPP
jgi:rhamnose transport system permease protein